MNKLSIDKRAEILSILTEGAGVNAACRITGASKNAVLRTLAEVGTACQAYQDRVMHGMKETHWAFDEQWSFVGMKEKNVPHDLRGTFGIGDVYLWIAIAHDSKVIPCWHVGTRGAEYGYDFVHDFATRLDDGVHPQIDTDGHAVYVRAIEDAFGARASHVQIVKNFAALGQTKEDQRRYSPAECTGVTKARISGNPNMRRASTSYVERVNLSMRMQNRRFTRLTNAYSRKLENHAAAIALNLMAYNFCKVHSKLRVSPAMEAGITDTVWTMKDVVMMAETMPVTK